MKLILKVLVKELQEISNLKQEHFVCLCLDSRRQLINKHTVFIGTLTSVISHPREVFARAIDDSAASIVIAHNHPSGTTKPTDKDIEITQQFVAAGLILGIPVTDHVIVSGDHFFSFQLSGLIDADSYLIEEEIPYEFTES